MFLRTAVELHLKTLCDVNGVSYKPKSTIEPLAQALYEAKKLDLTELKYIQYLGSIRNKCSHSEPVSAKEVQSLIDGVKKTTGNGKVSLDDVSHA